MPARRSTLRNLRNVEIISFAPLATAIFVAACSNSPSLSHILYSSSSSYSTALQRYHRSQKRTILLVHFSVRYLRLGRASSKITAASRRMSSRFVGSTPCFLCDKDSRIKSSRRATGSLLRAGVLILFWAENPRSYSIACYIQIIDVQVLLHSTAIARPRTIRIIETTYSSEFASL